MRQAGTLPTQDQAQRFADYLLTLGISAKVDADGAGWAIWVRDEDQLPDATRELQQFAAEPDSDRYRQAGQAAQSLRQQQTRVDAKRRKNWIEMRQRWDTRPAGRRPLTLVLIAACVLVAV